VSEKNGLIMERERKLGVVLFQLGGPDSLDAVEPFLYNLFLDPDIIDFPFAKMARPALAKLISATRSKKVKKGYAAIGGKSPIVEWTARQARALEDVLRPALGAHVVVAMRYWHPFTEEAIEELHQSGCEELVLLPLYPQYSKTTTGSSLNEWNRRFPGSVLSDVPVRVIRDFYQHPTYIASLVEHIENTLSRFPDPHNVHLVFSAHGVPVAVIQEGDPYQRQIEETSRLVMEQGQWNLPHTVCYQSQVGSGRWLQPSIHEVVPRLAGQGVRDLLIVPVSFVSDHIETLHEIDREVREEAMEAGVRQFELMPGLNDSSQFIRALADLVFETVGAAVPK
jgi:protoporphyrin/coproporphyrin ferrochelatase